MAQTPVYVFACRTCVIEADYPTRAVPDHCSFCGDDGQMYRVYAFSIDRSNLRKARD